MTDITVRFGEQTIAVSVGEDTAEASRQRTLAESARDAAQEAADTVALYMLARTDDYFAIKNASDSSIVARWNMTTGAQEGVSAAFSDSVTVGGMMLGTADTLDGVAVRDDDGQVVARLADETGRSSFAEVETDTLAATTSLARRSFRHAADRVPLASGATVNILVHAGQSWGEGIQAVPPVTMEPRYPGKVLMFSGGVVQQNAVALASATLVDAYEQEIPGTVDFPTTPAGETGAVAMANHVLDMIAAENNIAASDQDMRLLVFAPGEGSKSIEQLSGSPYTDRISAAFARAYDLCQAEGVSVRVAAVTWTQGSGSSDDPAIPGDATVEYTQEMENLRAAITAIAQATIPGHGEIPLITWQCNPASSVDASDLSARNVGLRFFRQVYGVDTVTGELDHAGAFPHIYCSNASYHLQRVGGAAPNSSTHFLPQTAARYGRELGFALKRVVFDGVDYVPLAMTHWERQGKLGVIHTTHLPQYGARGSLAIDTTTAKAATAYGLQLWSAGVQIAITSGPYLGPGGTIVFGAAANIPAGAELAIAGEGSDYTYDNMWRANFRDDGASYLRGVDRWLLADRIACAN